MITLPLDGVLRVHKTTMILVIQTRVYRQDLADAVSDGHPHCHAEDCCSLSV